MHSKKVVPSLVNFCPAALSISVQNSATSPTSVLLSCGLVNNAHRMFSRLRRSCRASSLVFAGDPPPSCSCCCRDRNDRVLLVRGGTMNTDGSASWLCSASRNANPSCISIRELELRSFAMHVTLLYRAWPSVLSSYTTTTTTTTWGKRAIQSHDHVSCLWLFLSTRQRCGRDLARFVSANLIFNVYLRWALQ